MIKLKTVGDPDFISADGSKLKVGDVVECSPKAPDPIIGRVSCLFNRWPDGVPMVVFGSNGCAVCELCSDVVLVREVKESEPGSDGLESREPERADESPPVCWSVLSRLVVLVPRGRIGIMAENEDVPYIIGADTKIFLGDGLAVRWTELPGLVARWAIASRKVLFRWGASPGSPGTLVVRSTRVNKVPP